MILVFSLKGCLFQPRALPWETLGKMSSTLKGSLMLIVSDPFRVGRQIRSSTQAGGLGWRRQPFRLKSRRRRG